MNGALEKDVALHCQVAMSDLVLDIQVVSMKLIDLLLPKFKCQKFDGFIVR